MGMHRQVARSHRVCASRLASVAVNERWRAGASGTAVALPNSWPMNRDTLGNDRRPPSVTSGRRYSHGGPFFLLSLLVERPVRSGQCLCSAVVFGQMQLALGVL